MSARSGLAPPLGCARGFSMVEVLIALVVTSIGLLGLAALQVTSLKINHSAYLRSQATEMAHDMADRMRANRIAATSGNYNLAYATDPSGTSSVAAADLTDWHDTLERELPGGDGAVTVNAAGLALISVHWNDARGDTGAENTDADADGLLEFRLATEI